MNRLDGMLTRAFFPILAVSILFFVLILQLVDLFANLVQYLDLEIPALAIVTMQLLFVPRGFLYALPIATLFASSLTLGMLYSNNELISVFAAGISLYRFVLPLLVIGALLSISFFFVEDHIAIPADRLRSELQQEVFQIGRSYSGSNVTVLAVNHSVVYYADYYNDVTESLNGVVVIRMDSDGRLLQRIDADWAQWQVDHWAFNRARIYTWNEDQTDLVPREANRYIDTTLNEPPATFARGMRDVGEMTSSEARVHIESLRSAGIPFRGALTSYYERFTFALTPLVVIALSSAIGGRFKRNILLMSLLVSLSLAVLYYVTGMVTGLMAQSGMLHPLAGASIPIVLFLVATGLLFFRSRT